MNKIKILFYSGHGEVVGGDARYLFDLINNLNSNKYDIQLFTDKNYLFAERAKQWLKNDIKINYLDTRPILFKKILIQKLYNKIESYQGKNKLIFLIRNILNTKFLLERSVYRWLNYIYYRIVEIITLAKLRYNIHNALIFYRLLKNKKKEIDIIHFNNGGYPAKQAVLIAIIVAHFLRIKNIVMTAHGVALPKRWYKFSDHIFDYFIPKFCKKVITSSENSRLELNKKRKFPLDIITAIVLGANDVDALTPDEVFKKKQKLGLLPDQPLLIISGGIYGEAKGHNVLFKAIVEIKKIYPAVKLLVAGDGKGLPDLQRLANELNLDDNIKFLGYRKDICELNSIVNIVIVPSITSEGIPFTCLEALRAGKALITTNVGGCVETVENGASGLIIKKNDSQELAKAILKLLGNKELTKKMGEAGRKMFEEKFLLSTEIKKHEQFYLNILNKK